MSLTAASWGMSRRSVWLALAAGWLITVAGVVTWLLGTSTGTLREQLKTAQFWSLECCVLAGLLLAVLLFRELQRALNKRDVLHLVLLALLSAGLTLFVATRTNRIFYDEQIYQSIGQNLADVGLAQVCTDGTVEYGRLQCWSGEYNKQPYGYPHALSLAYRLAGVRTGTAFAVNAAAAAATTVTVYLLVCVLFRDRDAALYAGLLLTLIPEQVIWSATAAVEPSASLAATLAVLSAAYFRRSGSSPALGAAAVTAAYAVQFRPESLLILPVAWLLMWPRLGGELRAVRTWGAGLLFVALVATHAGHLFAVRHSDWGTSEARFALAYVAPNLRVNGWFFLHDARFPAAFTLLAVLGAARPSFRRERVVMAGYFLLYFSLGLLFYAGSYNYGADVRYSLMTYPPIAVLGGLGAAQAVRFVSSLAPALPVGQLAVAVLLFQFLHYTPLVRATTEEAWAARADVRFAQSFASELPANSYVLTHNPGMFQLWGVSAGQMSQVMTNPDYVAHLIERYTGGVYVHWNFWCNVDDPIQEGFCRAGLALRPVEMVREYRERDQRFAFYRLRTPEP